MAVKIMSLLLLLYLLMIGVAYAGSLEDYKPKSSDEEAIVALLKKNQETWNNGDANSWMTLWHENAKIMYGRERTIATKNEYQKIIKDRMAAQPSIKFGDPKITVSGNEAVAKTLMQLGSRSSPMTFTLLKQNERWLFTSWKY